jgi:hypothetical protein
VAVLESSIVDREGFDGESNDEGAYRPRHVSGSCGKSACRWYRRSRTSSTRRRR